MYLGSMKAEINKISKSDVSSAIRIVYDLRDSLENTIYYKETELFEDNINYMKLLKRANQKTIELFEYNKNGRKVEN